VGGALPEAELMELAAEAGFKRGRIVRRFDAYGGTTAKERLSRDLHVRGVTFTAIR
jgi:hypothetical protein